jgi:hypothetical protein
MSKEKCRYQGICHYFIPGTFICERDEQAKNYCGVYSAHERADSRKFAKPSGLVQVKNLPDPKWDLYSDIELIDI